MPLLSISPPVHWATRVSLSALPHFFLKPQTVMRI
jgi:hypothetical protein